MAGRNAAPPPVSGDLDRVIARLLMVGTYLAVCLLAAGVAVLLGTGRSPLEVGPGLDLARLPGDLASLRPEGFLWLGLLAVIATPAARVISALVAFVRRSERVMAVVAVTILAVIGLGIVLALATGA